MKELNKKEVRALGLCSGGLDSILSGVLLRELGITVEWISFETPFFSSENARKASQQTGIPLIVENITPVYLDMLKNPPCGYGKYMNPCLDCHSLMFNCAGKMMEARGYHFLFSGEVLGQRPMSQTRSSLRYVEKHSGYDGYILRPLSAKRLPETLPEKKGQIDRERLLDITGRSRKRQAKLAEIYGIDSYPAPAGGCLLTDKNYSKRLKDVFNHKDPYTETALHLLKYGRHLRFEDGTKIIIGRSQSDNKQILKYYNPHLDVRIYFPHVPGPTVLIPGGTNSANIRRAASIGIGYSKAGPGVKTAARIISPTRQETIDTYGISYGTIKHLIIGN